jgi:hypothetical protein
MSLLIAVVVVYGFSHTIGHNLLHPSPIPPFILTIHAIVFPGWVLFFILQSSLVRTRNVRLHRTLGWFGLALGILIIVLGYFTATAMDRFFMHSLHYAGAPAFLIIQLTDLLCFAVPFALAFSSAGVDALILLGILARPHRRPSHPQGVSLRLSAAPRCPDLLRANLSPRLALVGAHRQRPSPLGKMLMPEG